MPLAPVNLGVIRLSDLKDSGEQTGPIRQREAIIKDYALIGVQPGDIVWAEDLDVSAFHVSPLKRPMLRRAFNNLPPGSKVKFYRLDRFVRRVFPDFSDMISFAADRKLELSSATEALDLLKLDGMMVATLLAFVAQKESENTSARVKNSQEYLRRVGRYGGGPLPYGYRPVQLPDQPGWYLMQDPDTCYTLREAAERVLTGHSVNSVAAWLNRKGMLSPIDRSRELRMPPKPRICSCGHDKHVLPCDKLHKCRHRRREGRKLLKLHEYDECSEPCPAYQAREWSREGLYQILRSPAICGYVVENKVEIVRDEKGMPISFAPGIIDEDTWHQLQAVMDGRAAKKVRTASDSLLLNVAYCVHEAPLYIGTTEHDLTTGPEVRHYYKTSRGPSLKCPGCRSIRVDALDPLISRELLKTLGDRKVLVKVESTAHRMAIEAERRTVAAGIMELTQEMFVRGRPRDNHDELMKQLQGKHADLTKELDAEDIPEIRLVETDERFSDKWAAMETLDRRLWLMDAGVRVVATKGKMPPIEFLTLPKLKRSMIIASEDDVHAVIYLGNLGEMLRRASAA